MLTATLLALAAAALHATWNLLIKTSGDRLLASWGQFLFGAILFLPVVLVAGWPERAAWPFLGISAVIHVLYVEGLARAYQHGEFSLAYPLARGGGAMVAAIGGTLFLDDTLGVPSWAALAVVAVGLGSMVRPNAGRSALGWATFTALVIGSYSTIDAAGSKHSSNGFVYGVALTICSATMLSVWGVARGRGPAFVATWRGAWRLYVVAGVALTSAYSLVLVAVRIPGVSAGYVFTLRESSVVLGALAGWLLLKESMGRARLLSSVVVLLGMIGLVLAKGV